MQRSPGASQIAKVEAARQKMTPEQVKEFAELCDKLCKAAYIAKAKWFEKIVTAKGSAGRDQLYVWVKHWLSAYLMKPVAFKKNCGV